MGLPSTARQVGQPPLSVMNEWRFTQQCLCWRDRVLFCENIPGALDQPSSFTSGNRTSASIRVGLGKGTPPEVGAVNTVAGIFHSVTGDLC